MLKKHAYGIWESETWAFNLMDFEEYYSRFIQFVAIREMLTDVVEL